MGINIKRVIILLIFLFVSLISIDQVYNKFINDITDANNTYIISKKSNVTNKQFLNEIIQLSDKYNVQVMSESFNKDQNNNDIITYYVSENHHIYNQFDDKGNDFKLSSCKNNQELKVPNFYGCNEIDSINNMKDQDLTSKVYYLKGQSEDINNFINNISSYSTVELYNQAMYLNGFFHFPLYLFIILILSLIIDNCLKKKEYAIKQLNGYSSWKIIKEDSKYFTKNLIILNILAVVIVLIIILVLNPNIVLQITIHTSIMLLLLDIFLIILNLLIILFLQNYQIKENIANKYSFKSLYYVTLFVKIILLILTIYFLSNSVNNYVDLKDNYNYSKEATEKLSGYVTIPINMKGIPPTTDVDEKQDIAGEKFYKNTEEELDGILINSRDYRNQEDLNTCQQFIDCNLVINENYLDINPINYQGEIKDDAYNILIPKSKVNQKDLVASKFISSTQITEDQINFIEYKNNTKFYTYNVRSEEYIIDPLIYLVNDYTKEYNNKYFSDISAKFYFVNTNTDNPYNELLPYLEESQMIGFVPEVNYLADDFFEAYQKSKQNFFKNVLMIIIAIFFLAILLIYNTYFYISINKRDIGVKLMSGYSLNKIFNKFYRYLIIDFLILMIFGMVLNISFYLIIIFCLIEILFVFTFTKILIEKQISNIIKGE